MRSHRTAWAETLISQAQHDQSLLVLDADLASSTKSQTFDEAFPDRFIQSGIAEQNMAGMAFGLSTVGYRPWISSFAVFLTHRALDAVRMLISQTKAPVRIAGGYSGLLNGKSGKTHQDIEDLAIMRAMPGMTVLAPCDDLEVEAATAWASQHSGPVYMRLARDSVERIHGETPELVPGQVIHLRDGKDGVLISTGAQTSRTLKAAELLQGHGRDLTVLHLPCLKPLDVDQLTQHMGSGPVFTVEEHSRIGGLGGLVAEVLAERDSTQQVIRIGLEDIWSESAPDDFLLEKYGLSSRRVAEQVLAFFERKRQVRQ